MTREMHYEKRYLVTAVKNDGFNFTYNKTFKTRKEAEIFADEARYYKGRGFNMEVAEIEVIC